MTAGLFYGIGRFSIGQRTAIISPALFVRAFVCAARRAVVFRVPSRRRLPGQPSGRPKRRGGFQWFGQPHPLLVRSDNGSDGPYLPDVADDDAYRYANPTKKEPLVPVRQADRQRHIRTTAETRTCSFAATEHF